MNRNASSLHPLHLIHPICSRRLSLYPLRTVLAALTAILLPILTAGAFAQKSAPPSTSAYSALLVRYVDEAGRVDYASLKTSRASLDAYVSAIGSTTAAEYESWSSKQRMAFLINAYNAITLRSVIDAYPVKSIMDIDGVWKKKTWPIIGTRLTLDQIEHERLRRDWREPRIHMAVNCASVGCPSLRREAFTADRLEQQLEEQTRAFFKNPLHFKADPANRTIHISKLFEWFKADFGKTSSFIGKYVDPATADLAKGWRTKTKYIDYDWSLNGK